MRTMKMSFDIGPLSRPVQSTGERLASPVAWLRLAYAIAPAIGVSAALQWTLPRTSADLFKSSREAHFPSSSP